MITRESFYENREELQPIISNHWKEVSNPQVPLDINWGAYKALEDAGLSFSYIARDNGIAGYVSCFLMPHHHHQTVSWCSVDMIYVAPSHRGRWLGVKLLKQAEQHARSLCDKSVMNVSGQRVDISPLAKRLGYHLEESIYRKVL